MQDWNPIWALDRGLLRCFDWFSGEISNSVELVLVANGNRYEVDSETFFLSGKALYPYKILPCMDSDLFWHAFASVICGNPSQNRGGNHDTSVWIKIVRTTLDQDFTFWSAVQRTWSSLTQGSKKTGSMKLTTDKLNFFTPCIFQPKN
jgi:hypothetical protein